MKQFPFILLLLIFNACQQTENEINVNCTNNTMYLPQMAKDFFLFKDGTYWIYENQKSKEIDSLYVNSFSDLTNNKNVYSGRRSLIRCYENLYFSIYKKNKRFLVSNLTPSGQNNYNNFKNQFFLINVENDETEQGYTFVEFFGDSIISSENLQNIILKIDSFQIKNKIYKDIIQIENKVIGLDTKHLALYAKNIGLIHYITFDNQEYDLIRYHIEQ